MAKYLQTSFHKILILVFGIAFGLIALALVYQGVKTSNDIRSRAASNTPSVKCSTLCNRIPSANLQTCLNQCRLLETGQKTCIQTCSMIPAGTARNVCNQYCPRIFTAITPTPTCMPIPKCEVGKPCPLYYPQDGRCTSPTPTPSQGCYVLQSYPQRVVCPSGTPTPTPTPYYILH